MMNLSDVGFACIRRGVKPFRLGYVLERYRKQYRLIELLQRQRVDLVLDVGGSNGMWARGIRNLGFDKAILSFEPIPQEMEKSKLLNGTDTWWRGYQVAIGSEDGDKVFNVVDQEGTAFCSSFLQPTDLKVTSSLTVKVARLDSILAHTVSPHLRIFLKTDTQGFDMEVLKGAGKLLDQVVVLQMEMSASPIYEGMTHHTEAMAYLESQGFKLAALDVVDHHEDGRVIEYDCLMVK
jgi:FkbM family methyltransferase